MKVLELNLAGARGEVKSGELQAARLQEEIRALQREVERLRSQRADAQAGPTG